MALQPIWTRLTTLVQEDATASRTTIIGTVDCTKENELCNKEKVRGYPTLKIFRAFDPIGTEYDGPRDLSSLIELLQKQLALEIQKPGEQQEAEPLSSKTTFLVKGMSWEEIDGDEGDEDPEEDAVLNREDDIRSLIPEPISGLYELNEDNYQKFLAKGRHLVKFFTTWCSHCQMLEPTWLKLANSLKYEKSASISRINCETYPHVCEEFEVKGYPTILWIVDGKVVSKYDGTRTHSDLKKFVIDKVTEDMESGGDVRSEDYTLQLTETSFDKAVSEGVSFVMFTAPWCSHCKRLSPIIDQLTIKFAPEKEVRIAQIDCSQFDSFCSGHGVDAYPTLILYKWGVRVEEYEGEMTLQDMHSFIQKHMTPKDEL